MQAQGIMCARLGCGDTNTKEVSIAGHAGRAYRIYLCETHKREIEQKGEI